MLNAIFSSPRAAVLEQAINASSLRQKVISNNIANVNTPGFKKSDVIFEDVLNEALNGNGKLPMVRTNEKHLPLMQRGVPSPLIQTDTNTSLRTDGNNVDIDGEMANMAKNNIYYNAVVQQLSGYFSGIKSVIKEGKG